MSTSPAPFPFVSVGATSAAAAAAACSSESSCSLPSVPGRAEPGCTALLLWVLIMETKRVEIPGSVLDDLCRYRGAHCSAPCRPLLFLSRPPQFPRPRKPPRLLSWSTSLSRLSRPASAPFPCRLLSPTTPTFFFRSACLFLTLLHSSRSAGISSFS